MLFPPDAGCLHALRLIAKGPATGHLRAMFMVSAEIVEAVRTTFHTKGEWTAAAELRRLYPAISDNKAALERKADG